MGPRLGKPKDSLLSISVGSARWAVGGVAVKWCHYGLRSTVGAVPGAAVVKRRKRPQTSANVKAASGVCCFVRPDRLTGWQDFAKKKTGKLAHKFSHTQGFF